MNPAKPNNVAPPLAEALMGHASKQPVSFHVPGHKAGRAFQKWGDDPYMKAFQAQILQWDQTEIDGLDDLHAPEEAIRSAQQRTAAIYGAQNSYFLVNGSTVGNLAMIHTVCKPGDTVLVQRNCHKSILHGLMLVGVRPVYLTPRYEKTTGIPTGVTIEQVQSALRAFPEAGAVILTHPNYHGMATSLVPIADACHQKGIPLLVDEAHGAHFGFHSAYPASAIQQGADLVVQSTHKMGMAMTMGACLHTNGDRFDAERLRWYLSVLQSSSPSYPILASIDLSTYFMETYADTWLADAKGQTEAFYKSLERSHHALGFLHPNDLNDAYEAIDPLKITIATKGNMTGYQLKEELQRRRLYMELAQEDYVLAVVGPGTEATDLGRLALALEEIVEARPTLWGQEIKQDISNIVWNKELWEASELPLSQWMSSRSESLPWRNAIGKISGEMIIPYPPGVPLVHVGERFTEAKMEWIQDQKHKGLKFHGVADSTLETVRVLSDV